MPQINKPKKKRTYKRHGKAKEIYDNVYNTSTWKNLRKSYLMLHPVCEECNKRWATQVHHIKEISKATSTLEMKDIGFDSSNLMALCEECHQKKHGKK